ncbi:MAG: hypothetical protein LHW52_04975, partial [Candidatus Cloacimonetes bacterium]|nr:hypothetical protein [Candidatus Cloacimonadota bacterium]
YSFQEHLDGFGLINMNSRVYDPIVSRMLSLDNFIQAPGYSQSLNRFSYCWNNPLKYTDPSGQELGVENNRKFFWWTHRGSSNSSYGIGPGSNNHWSDPYRNKHGDFMLMSSTGYNNKHGNGASGIAYRNIQTRHESIFSATGQNAANFWANISSGSGDLTLYFYDNVFSNTVAVLGTANQDPGFSGNDLIAYKTSDAFGLYFGDGGGVTASRIGSVGGGYGLSTNFVAGASWAGFVAGSKKGYNIINNELIRQGHYNNSIRKPRMPLDDVTSLKVPKGLKIVGKYGGLVFTFYGAYDIDQQWRNNEINDNTMIIEQISNGIGAIPLVGTGWSIGWNLGKSWGPSTWYGTNDYKWFE